MLIPTEFLAILYFMGAIGFALFFTYFLPNIFQSVARYKFWEARDLAYDGVKNRELRDFLVETAEIRISRIRKYSLLMVWVHGIFEAPGERQLAKKIWDEVLKGTDEDDARIVEEYRRKTAEALTIKIFLGSGSGFPITCVMVIMLLPYVLAKQFAQAVKEPIALVNAVARGVWNSFMATSRVSRIVNEETYPAISYTSTHQAHQIDRDANSPVLA